MSAEWELVIGLETHVQLATASKMFCACSADYDGAEPNSLVCPVCLGLPGTLPRPNRAALEQGARLALALGCRLAPVLAWDRKNYHYPDLPKGYQITQHARPLGVDGHLPVPEGPAPWGGVRVARVHLEEDTAKLTHQPDATWLDFNRAGLPLLEVVTGPDLASPEAASAYLETLRWTLRWLGVSSAQMEAGALRVDVNVSLRRPGEAMGTKVEVKNLNSFAAVRAALAHERERQAALLARGEPVRQETRGWLEAEGRTTAQRSKEQAHDYRYFPEPDLPPARPDPAWLAGLAAGLGELPWERRARFASALGLGTEAARLLTREPGTADYFEAALADYGGPPATLASWVTGELAGALNAAGLDMAAGSRAVPPAHLAELLRRVESGSLGAAAAKTVLATMVAEGAAPGAIVEREGLGRIGRGAELSAAVAETLAAHPQAVADYRLGKASAVTFLVGGVMKRTRGQADPNLAREQILEALGEAAPRPGPANGVGAETT